MTRIEIESETMSLSLADGELDIYINAYDLRLTKDQTRELWEFMWQNYATFVDIWDLKRKNP